MKTVTFQVKFKEQVLGTFRTKVPTDDDLDAFEKATKFGEFATGISIVSIDNTTLNEDAFEQEQIKLLNEMSTDELVQYFTNELEEVFDKIGITTQSLSEADTIEKVVEDIPKLEDLGMSVLKLARLSREIKQVINKL